MDNKPTLMSNISAYNRAANTYKLLVQQRQNMADDIAQIDGRIRQAEAETNKARVELLQAVEGLEGLKRK